MNRKYAWLIPTICLGLTAATALAQKIPAAKPNEKATVRSHPAMRPLPGPSTRPIVDGPKLFVDAARGNDAAAGSEKAPWKTLRLALRRLKPGDTLYLRGGTYYEKVSL